MTRLWRQPRIKGYRRTAANDGRVFDSKKEAKRYAELQLLAAAGEISDLELQPEFPIIVGGRLVCKYRGDFSYNEKGAQHRVCEDSKGMRTEVYKLKMKLVKALYPHIEFRES